MYIVLYTMQCINNVKYTMCNIMYYVQYTVYNRSYYGQYIDYVQFLARNVIYNVQHDK